MARLWTNVESTAFGVSSSGIRAPKEKDRRSDSLQHAQHTPVLGLGDKQGLEQARADLGEGCLPSKQELKQALPCLGL